MSNKVTVRLQEPKATFSSPVRDLGCVLTGASTSAISNLQGGLMNVPASLTAVSTQSMPPSTSSAQPNQSAGKIGDVRLVVRPVAEARKETIRALNEAARLGFQPSNSKPR
jgi:hypothetical protein